MKQYELTDARYKRASGLVPWDVDSFGSVAVQYATMLDNLDTLPDDGFWSQFKTVVADVASRTVDTPGATPDPVVKMNMSYVTSCVAVLPATHPMIQAIKANKPAPAAAPEPAA